jgi:hypothetical protein
MTCHHEKTLISIKVTVNSKECTTPSQVVAIAGKNLVECMHEAFVNAWNLSINGDRDQISSITIEVLPSSKMPAEAPATVLRLVR